MRLVVAVSTLAGVAFGCSDPTAANYRPAGTSGYTEPPCVYGEPELYCGDAAAQNYDAQKSAAGAPPALHSTATARDEA